MSKTPQQIIDTMLSEDTFAVLLGVEVLKLTKGACQLRMTVRSEMLNGLNVAHGGITYSLSDTALAFAASTHGNKCVSVQTSISHLQEVYEGDCLTAKTFELSLNRKIGIYQVEVHNQENILVSRFEGKVFRKDEMW